MIIYNVFDKIKWVWWIDVILIIVNLKENLFKFNKNGLCIKYELCKGFLGLLYKGCF